MVPRRNGRVSASNILLLAVVFIVALLFYFNLGSSTNNVGLQEVTSFTSITESNATSVSIRTEPFATESNVSAVGVPVNSDNTKTSVQGTQQKTAIDGFTVELQMPQKDDPSLHVLRKERFVWREESKLPTFYLYDLTPEADTPEQDFLHTVCKAGIEPLYCDFLFTGKRRVKDPRDAQIFLVPIFQSILFTKIGLYSAVRLLTRERYFMKYRGSDFVFICYTSDCSATRQLLLEGLGKSVRAMWVDRGGHWVWPCSNRNLNVTIDNRQDTADINWLTEAIRVQNILKRANALITGRVRWECTSMETWELKNPTAFDFATIKDTSFKSIKNEVAYCGVPKVGSSVAVLMMRRMNDMPDWKKKNTVQIRNFHSKTTNWTYKGQKDLYDIFNQTHWVKGMLVRNPISRLLSGYKSKILDLREYSRIPGGGWPANAKPPSMKEFIDKIKLAKLKGNLDWMDRHIRPQSALCGVRTLPYDFIGRYEERQRDMEDFLRSLELWDKIGASGWGLDGNSALYEEDEHIIRHNKPKPVTHSDSKEVLGHFYTRDLIKAVIHLYDEDFTRFGYSKNPDDYI